MTYYIVFNDKNFDFISKNLGIDLDKKIITLDDVIIGKLELEKK